MKNKIILSLMLLLTLSFSINNISYANDVIKDKAKEAASYAGDKIEDAATLGVDKAKEAVDKYFEDNNINVSYYKNRNWLQKLWDGIKSFFKNLFSFLIKDSKDELISTANYEIGKAASNFTDSALDGIISVTSDNLDITSQGVLTSMIDNAKNMDEEERINNIVEVGSIFANEAAKLTTPIGTISGLADGLSQTFDASNLTGSNLNPDTLIDEIEQSYIK